jgi:hypothetical protein
MATNSSKVYIDIITQFTGKNSIKQADNAFASLTSTIKRFVSVYAVERLVKSSIDAFKEQQVVLAGYDNSLKNLGTSYAAIAPVIEKTTSAFMDLGFQDNQTIEALTKLTTALGNPAKALDVLGVTADLARYKTKPLAETATLVAKAIAGNSRAFADLGLKIDKTLTPQNAFNKLLDEAQSKAGGAAKAYAKTLAGSLDIAAAKTENASEILGQKLAPSIQKLAEFGVKYLVPLFGLVADNIEPLIAMASAIGLVALAIKGVGIASAVAAGEMALNPLFAGAALIAFLGYKAATSKKTTVPADSMSFGGYRLGARGLPPVKSPTAKKVDETKKLTTAEKLLADWEKKWNASALKAANDLKKSNADKLKLEKESQILKTAAKVLDVDQAQILAALGKKISDEDRTRLLLQQALLNDNADAAGKLAQTVITAQEAALLAQKSDPFGGWNDSLQIVLDNLKKLATELALLGVAKVAPTTLALDAQNAITDSMNLDFIDLQDETDAAKKLLDDALAASKKVTDQLNSMLGVGNHDISTSWFAGASGNGSTSSSIGGVGNPMGNITLMVDGQVLGAITTSQQQNTTASGVQLSTTRLNPLGTGF